MKPSPWTGMHFLAALYAWLKAHRKNLAPRTITDYEHQIPQLGETFSEICDEYGIDYSKFTIDAVTADLCHEYQDKRKAGWQKINSELGIVKQCRDDMRKPIGFKRLKKPKGWKSPGKPVPEYKKVMEVCVKYADNPRYEVAALTTLVMIGSGLGPGEMKCLRLQHVTIAGVNEDGIEVPTSAFVGPEGAKRRRRIRSVVLPGLPEHRAEWAMKRLLARAKSLGCTSDDHYLLPRLNKKTRKYDPTKPCDSWKSAMRHIYAMAGVKFRPYDCRHHAISRGLKDPRVAFAQASDHFGHISPVMRATYYHGDIESSQLVADAIAGKKSRPVEKEVQSKKKPMERADDDNRQTPEGTGTWQYLHRF